MEESISWLLETFPNKQTNLLENKGCKQRGVPCKVNIEAIMNGEWYMSQGPIMVNMHTSLRNFRQMDECEAILQENVSLIGETRNYKVNH